jgi:cobalt-precorrin 5A hydrolase / cobalt-factor III methyltransferase / precorrin-3B C17-methyltransferase
VIGLIAVTAAGRAAAARLAAAWPSQTYSYDGPVRQALPRAWAQCDGLVCFLAVGATVRLIAPLLDSKWTDPAVVCIDESARHAVAVVGGHAAGANALAARVAAVFGAEAVITTATDAVSMPGLDTLGWVTEGAVGTVSRALLDREPVRLEADATWPLPALPATVGEAGEYRILITDRLVAADAHTAVLRPPSLVVGVDAGSAVVAEDLLGLVGSALAEARLSPACVTALATVDGAAGGPGAAEAARARGWVMLSYPASQLTAAEGRARRRAPVGTGSHGVAEAAALAGGGELVIPSRRSAGITVAVARIRPRGRLALIDLGPGARDLLTPRAVGELRRASVVAGSRSSLDEVADLLRPGTRVLPGGPGDEEVSARAAVLEARQGHAVALAGSGDAGVHALASHIVGLAGDDVDVVGVPGVTAAAAAAALLGAPLGNGAAAISLAGLHAPWEAAERRVRAAAEADSVVTFCQPRRPTADWQLAAALAILAEHRPPGTPAVIVRDAGRPCQQAQFSTITALDPDAVHPQDIVIVGSSTTRIVAGRLVTPGE